ncbi:MAG: hypothetical protein C0522_15180, partial [Rhodocyclaceae bacterium]|nr:hypothetical protein [Rhodocyclaceae bacterium]
MPSVAVWSALAALAGACGPLQAVLTAQAGDALGSRYYGALVSYVGGALAVLVVAALSGQPNWSGV